MTFAMIIAVTISNQAVIISSEQYADRFDGHYCSDNNFDDAPTTPGVYRCTVEYSCSPDFGDGDYDERFKVLASTPIELEA